MGCKACCQKIPTRYLIMAMIFFSTYINYSTRSNLSVSLPAMVSSKKRKIAECLKGQGGATSNNTTPKPEIDTGTKYDWSETIQGNILGAYFVGFFCSSLPAGAVAEWVGPFWTIFMATLITAVLNSACVWLAPLHWGALYVARFLIGLAGGLVYPALQCLIGRWAPPQEKTKFVACLMGNTLGTCVTWIICGAVTRYYKWPWGFHVFSFQIVLFLIVFWFLTYDSPEQHKWITDEELDFIKGAQEGTVSKTKAIAPYKRIFTSFPFWCLVILHTGNLWGLSVQILSAPKFMKEYVGYDVKDSAILSSLPHFVRLLLGFGYGFIGDFLKKRKYRRVVILKSFVLLSHVFPGVLMALMGLAKCNVPFVISLLTLSMSINGAVVITNLANPTDLAPNFAATLFSLISFIGGTTGFIVPAITGAIISSLGNNMSAWGLVFALGGGMYIGCGIFFMIFGTADIQPWNEKKEQKPAEST